MEDAALALAKLADAPYAFDEFADAELLPPMVRGGDVYVWIIRDGLGS